MNLITQFNVKEIGGAKLNASNEMLNSIELWSEIAAGNAKWNTEAPSCGIPAAIAGALADPIDEEIKIEAEVKEIDTAMKELDKKSTEIVTNIVLYGGCVVRPIYADGLKCEIVRLGNYYPTAYDFNGNLTGAVILKKIYDGDNKYLLAENHEYKNRTHSVTLKLYKIKGESSLKEVDLSACSQTATLTPFYSFPDVDRPMIIEFRNRRTNNIDGSNIPCAIYSGYENLIEDADRQYWRMNWEQEGGELRVFADGDLFLRRGPDGKEIPLPKKLARLITKTEGNGAPDGKIYTHSPALRTDSQIKAFNEILRRIEIACNIGKGTLSTLETQPQTATQYTGGKKALYSAVDTIESELEAKFKDVAHIFAHLLGAMGYETPRTISDKVTITFNDFTRKDPAEVKAQALREVSAGIMSKEEYRVLFYGEDETTAAEKVPKTETGAFVL